MSSIIKVDQIQLADGSTPTAGDLGLNTTGSVLQVVQGFTTSLAQTGSTSYLSTNLSASITPSSTSSKILIVVVQPISLSTDTADERIAYLRLLKGASELVEIPFDAESDSGTRTKVPVSGCINYLDSPSTTAEITYSTEMKLNNTSADIYAQNNSRRSTITLMEIAG